MIYFGTDGIRGIPNKSLSVDLAMNIGKSLFIFNNKNLIIGTDTRISKDLLSCALVSGALSSGLNVYFLDIVSTPAIMYLSKKYNFLGVIITASHNPYYYNGIKIINNGKKINSEEEHLINNFINNPIINYFDIGTFYNDYKMINNYHKFLLKNITPTKLSITIDCANGSLYKTAPYIFNLVSNNLNIIGDKPNGRNINDGFGSTNLNALRKAVLKNKSDIGFAYDGDADRVLCVNELANIVSGDILIYILALYYKKNNMLKNNKVVLTKMSNIGIINALKEEGIESVIVDVGDKNVLDEMHKQNICLGGETSGHIIIPKVGFGDGILVSLEILKILEETNTLLSDWQKRVCLYEECLENIVVKNKKNVMCETLHNKINEIKNILNNDCKIIVRASGTEDYIRVLVMAKNKEDVIKYQKEIIDLINFLDA